MIKDRFLVSVVYQGRFLDERLFTSFQRALMFGSGATVALAGLQGDYWMVTLKDRRSSKVLEFCLVEGAGSKRISTRMAKRIMKRRKAK